MQKRLYRSTTNKVIAGVCGGLGEYFNLDPVFIRVIAVILALIPHGFGIVAYIIAWIIIPKPAPSEAGVQAAPAKEKQLSSWNKYIPGLILIAIGLLLLLEDIWYWFRWEYFWPLLLIAAGVFLILGRTNRRETAPDSTVSSQTNNHQPGTENGGSLV
ncbi:MAG: PspC domain-containing protein [Candidatus Zixiibacteriota bacterium]|nr:MAG: PspC domain-containing protein [candidate division Zixibacteria bacterium]